MSLHRFVLTQAVMDAEVAAEIGAGLHESTPKRPRPPGRLTHPPVAGYLSAAGPPPGLLRLLARSREPCLPTGRFATLWMLKENARSVGQLALPWIPEGP